jgi:hypothetical protein
MTLSLPCPALAQQALQSIIADAASKKHELIREWWMMSGVRLLDSNASASSDPFVHPPAPSTVSLTSSAL